MSYFKGEKKQLGQTRVKIYKNTQSENNSAYLGKGNLWSNW